MIAIGRIEIINAVTEGKIHHLFRFLFIDGGTRDAVRHGETHCTEPQCG